VAREIERNPAVRAEFVEQTDAALAVAEGDEVFAEQPHPYRCAIGLGNLAGQQRRHPIAPHRLAHRRARTDPGDQFVVLAWQHGLASSPELRGRGARVAASVVENSLVQLSPTTPQKPYTFVLPFTLAQKVCSARWG